MDCLGGARLVKGLMTAVSGDTVESIFSRLPNPSLTHQPLGMSTSHMPYLHWSQTSVLHKMFILPSTTLVSEAVQALTLTVQLHSIIA